MFENVEKLILQNEEKQRLLNLYFAKNEFCIKNIQQDLKIFIALNELLKQVKK